MPHSAPSRFRRAQRIALASGFSISAAAHGAVLYWGRVPSVRPATAPAVWDGVAEAGFQPRVEVPPPPEPIPRPPEPLIPAVEVQDARLAPAASPPAAALELAAAPALPESLLAKPSFVRSGVPPLLENRAQFETRLERYYPAALRDAGVQGVVGLALFVDEYGKVVRTMVDESSGHAALDEAAAVMASEMRFLPALHRDRLVAVWISQRICFVILDRPWEELTPAECRRKARRGR